MLSSNAVKNGLLILTFFASSATTISFLKSDDNKNSTEDQIQQILTTQAACWNRGDIEGFMGTYWKSDELTFSGGGKTTRGWKATLDRYKKSYPKDKMGQLKFDGLEVSMLSADAALVLGFWHLKQPVKITIDAEEKTAYQQKDGNFSLVLKKVDGDWKIIHDHSSTDESDVHGDLEIPISPSGEAK